MRPHWSADGQDGTSFLLLLCEDRIVKSVMIKMSRDWRGLIADWNGRKRVCMLYELNRGCAGSLGWWGCCVGWGGGDQWARGRSTSFFFEQERM